MNFQGLHIKKTSTTKFMRNIVWPKTLGESVKEMVWNLKCIVK